MAKILLFLLSTFFVFSIVSGQQTNYENCLTKLNKMKNILNNLKLETTKHGKNVKIGNLETFYHMCIDTTNCVESMEIPELLKSILRFGTMFMRSACEDLGLKVGPFSKCMEKTKFDVTTLKNTTIGEDKPKCWLTPDEFSELQRVVQEQCGDEAWEDMLKNEDKVKVMTCENQP
ncbi:T20D4.11-like domain-containing protein [Caenorhabditis elegans]|uniref:T20D4.11-like domain-containing protein n=1 Tax=Caenorhabditis elegans TaxID=6239 RepID=Q9N474_CAEEL|nr:DUF19 domain-containing protein [Caenorhabditis elegans]CCD68139.1 DUF19 domain-containing protein [Caenorhabditis elegans]|eukprot:NP_490994.1 Uncharacterized protein CELE_Y23H5B.8 [Caenorhabditis elegans]